LSTTKPFLKTPPISRYCRMMLLLI